MQIGKENTDILCLLISNEDMMDVWHVNLPGQLRKCRPLVQIRHFAPPLSRRTSVFLRELHYFYSSSAARSIHRSNFFFSLNLHSWFTQNPSGNLVPRPDRDCPFPGHLLSSLPSELSRKEVIVHSLVSQMIKEPYYLRHWKNLNLFPKL